ncbi:extracellular serine-rich [Pyrrhoderma noxium]|uniref:Extracellular serine-rich n=1 Tax=Pyrrhoderma noxium TaxID=2282107 RepID=A0A286UX15_9AGAM|nr:extracellular serine-rich [Pyrrhoderma noxium]
MFLGFVVVTLSLLANFVAAENIYIQVSDGTGKDNTTVFNPQRVDAVVGDIVFFNFTSGNHTATQSTFSAPCVLAHDSNDTINGFDSGFRPTNNGTDITILSVPILDSNVNSPFWFYDASAGACGSGAVGVINNNESSTETLAGFVRNAERLNGTVSSASSSLSGSSSSTRTASSSSNTDTSSSALMESPLSFTLIAALALTALRL